MFVLVSVLAVWSPPSSTAQPPASSPVDWWAAFADYAPQGMPDFSQCRGPWSQPGLPPQWTHAGPVALANALWWLDSAAEPAPAPPSQPNDHYPLVTAYPRFGPPVDDHSPENVGPLVEDLAQRAKTNGQQDAKAQRGSAWEDLVAGVSDYLAARHLESALLLQTAIAPDPAWLRQQVANRAGVVLLLGVWEDQAGSWRRVGGHYVAVAGSSLTGHEVAVADPLADAAALGGPGQMEPPDPGLHSCRLAPRAHDDAAVVSHDLWALVQANLPGGQYVLEGYFTAATYGEAAAFRDQNPIAAFADHAGAWLRGRVVMALDAGLAIVPAPAAGTPMLPPATATLTPPPTPTAPGYTVLPPTATGDPTSAVPPLPTANGTTAPPPSAVPPGPTAAGDPTATATVPRAAATVTVQSRLWLPIILQPRPAARVHNSDTPGR